jgi:hypothetical protein
MPDAPAQRQRCSNARVTFAPDVAAIPEDEPLQSKVRGRSTKAAAAAAEAGISGTTGGGGGKDAAASSSSASDGAAEAAGYDAEAGCWPQQQLRRARWPVMPHFSDIGSGEASLL